jgi:hypothetical protein
MGSVIINYDLYLDNGNGYGVVATIPHELGIAMTITVTKDKDGKNLVAGSKNYFKVTAYNSKGMSDYSDEIVVAASPLPTAPGAPYKVISKSSLTSIFVEWNYVLDNSSPIIGYKLFMDEGNNGNFQLIFDGTGKPGFTSFLKSNLTVSKAYRFKVRSVNFNGESVDGTEVTLYSCLPPLNLAAPKYVSSTETTLTANWRLPQITNGCPIYKYRLYRDNGNNGEVNILVGEYEPHIS